MKKRILATVMSLLMIVTTILTLASCANTDGETGTTKDFGAPDKEYLDNLGEHDLGGYTVKFAVSEADQDGFHKRSIIAEADTGDDVDSAVYARNKTVEARFNCVIELTQYELTSNLASSTVNNVIMSGGDDYDVIAGRQYDDVSMCLGGGFINIATHPEASKYIQYKDLEYPYWSEGYIEGMTYGNHLYWLAGDLCLRFSGGYYCTFVNASIYEELLLDSEGSIYDIVKDKKWTIEKMKQLSEAAANVSATNVDQESIIGTDSVLGIACPVHDNTNGWAISAGVDFSQKDKNGKVVITANTKNTRLEDCFGKYAELIASSSVLVTNDEYGGYVPAFKVFAADNALMVPGRLNQAELYLREMPSDYYVVPCPMLDETQENYRSSVHDAVNLYAIAKGSANVKATAIVLEAMAAESYRTVRPAYYDNALKFKYTTDGESAEMIDILSDNSYIDFASVWMFTSYFSFGGVLRVKLKEGATSLVGYLSKQQKIFEANFAVMDKMYEKLESVG